jgi:hypothetical protein
MVVYLGKLCASIFWPNKKRQQAAYLWRFTSNDLRGASQDNHQGLERFLR